MMFATSLKHHIIDGYNFLMQNCKSQFSTTSLGKRVTFATDRDNDKICILGFSRGAYSAMCLAGMLYKVRKQRSF